MIANGKPFSSFSVNDLQKAKKFYSETLGLEVSESPMGLELRMTGGGKVFVYPKPAHMDGVQRKFVAVAFAGVQCIAHGE